MQFSGVNSVPFYTVTILNGVGIGLDAFLATNIIGLNEYNNPSLATMFQRALLNTML
jgi:hypothetical protein